MVHIRTISKMLFGGVGEIMMVSSAFLLGLFIIKFSPKWYFTLIIILGFMFIGIILRRFESEILGDLLSGHILKRLGRWITK